jgi:hypothetical protein
VLEACNEKTAIPIDAENGDIENISWVEWDEVEAFGSGFASSGPAALG